MKIWAKKTKEENGSYIDDNGIRYEVEWCVKVIYVDGRTEEDLGYTRFDSLDAALEIWHLTPYIDPDITEEEN